MIRRHDGALYLDAILLNGRECVYVHALGLDRCASQLCQSAQLACAIDFRLGRRRLHTERTDAVPRRDESRLHSAKLHVYVAGCCHFGCCKWNSFNATTVRVLFSSCDEAATCFHLQIASRGTSTHKPIYVTVEMSRYQLFESDAIQISRKSNHFLISAECITWITAFLKWHGIGRKRGNL